jgi:hypothetical protein
MSSSFVFSIRRCEPAGVRNSLLKFWAKRFLFYVLWAEGLLGLKLKEMYVVGDDPKKVSARLGDLEKGLLMPGCFLCLRNQFPNHACPRKGNIGFTECGVVLKA